MSAVTRLHEDGPCLVAPPVFDVLIVEDSEDIAEALSELLVDRGDRVRMARDGESALEAIGQRSADVVLLDLGLPDMDGYEVAAAIRARSGDQVRIVAITGFTGARAREQARRSRFD